MMILPEHTAAGQCAALSGHRGAAISAALALLALATSVAANPVKMATEARMDIEASPSVGSLSQGAATIGDGYLYRMDWVPQNAQKRTYVGNWPIYHFGWKEVGITFVPQSNGVVTVDLLGPWEMSPTGTIYRQDVVWDAVSATGASVSNGGFELLSQGVPVGWENPWDSVVQVTNSPPPFEGSNAVQVWHDQRLRTTFAVTGGQAVHMRAWVRAATPSGFVEQARIADVQSPAHLASRRFMRGVNLSNFLESPAGEDWGGGPIGAADCDAIRREGFDHVRLPVSWNYHTGPGPSYTISNAFFTRVDAVVTGLLSRGLGVIVNIHHFNEFYAAPSAWTNKLYAIWDQLSSHYASYTNALAFEILNEPHDNATTAFMNGIYAYLLPRLRVNNPERTVFVGTSAWNGIEELGRLVLPANDSNLIVTVHNYSPFYFTHQGAEWTDASTSTTNVTYPGPPATPISPAPGAAGNPDVVEWFAQYNNLPLADNPCSSNAFVGAFHYARVWSDYFGRPVHVGEFGAYMTAAPESRAHFYREMREALDREELGWAMWDWKAGFNYWNRATQQPESGMRLSMFPPPDLRWGSANGVIEATGAIGKRWILQQSTNGLTGWTAVATQILDHASFSIIPTATHPAAAYRILWEY